MKKLLLVLSIAFLGSCAPVRNISYFQDVNDGQVNTLSEERVIRVRPDDKISIIINSKDQMLMQLFNLPVTEVRVDSRIQTSSRQVSGYTVNKDGNIDFPVLGSVYVDGMTRNEIANTIKNRLVEEELVKDPIVTVEFVNLTVSLMGEVTRPGRYNIEKDKITLLDAISMAGDLTIYGVRENVTVLRETDGKQVAYKVDLLNAQELLQSPVYYLSQNDIVYVEPNDVRARQSTVNGNNIRSTSFWISLASLLTTVILLFI